MKTIVIFLLSLSLISCAGLKQKLMSSTINKRDVASDMVTFNKYQKYPLSGLKDNDVVVIKWKSVKNGSATDWNGNLDFELNIGVTTSSTYFISTNNIAKMSFSSDPFDPRTKKEIVNKEVRILGKDIRKAIFTSPNDFNYRLRIAFSESDGLFSHVYGSSEHILVQMLLDGSIKSLRKKFPKNNKKIHYISDHKYFVEAEYSIEVIKAD
ncbi:MAG: hypothetical protein HAW60_03515 [Bdellovibrionales bacterium]|nr:hypothetical protein [Bdellovibrionales bacterium]